MFLLEAPDAWHYGYDLSRRLGLRSGTLYPILVRLAERGCLETRWTELVYDGLWFSRERAAIDAFVDATQEVVSGEVRLSLRPSAAVVVGRRSELALYAETLASYASGETFPHEAAEGHIRIRSLETELVASLARRRAEV